MQEGSAPDASAARRVTCVECGKDFAPAETIRYQGVYVCQACKQAYFDRLWAAQAPLPATPRFASFGSRLAAKLIDTVILYVVQLPLSVAFVLNAPKQPNGDALEAPIVFSGVGVILYVLSLAITAAYNVYFVGRHGATPGKMALKIKVVMADGSALSYRRAASRYFGELLSSLTCLAGYLVAAFDQEGRALQDHVAGTRVVQNT